MNDCTVIGIDLAKHVFHLVGLDANGHKLFAKKLKREALLPFIESHATSRPVLAFEACSGAHYWARRFQEAGYTIRMLKPRDVTPFARLRQKNDTNDALAIAMASKEASLRSVGVKSLEQQQAMALHHMRQQTIETRIKHSNLLCAFLHERGFVVKVPPGGIAREARDLLERAHREEYIGAEEFEWFEAELVSEIEALIEKEARLNARITEQCQSDARAQRLQTIPGIGPINAHWFAKAMNLGHYHDGRDFASSLGLVPSQSTTGGKIRMGRITKRGSRYARTLLVQGARSILMHCIKRSQQGLAQGLCLDAHLKWAWEKYQKLGFNKAAVALANKMARILHACETRAQTYQPRRERKLRAMT